MEFWKWDPVVSQRQVNGRLTDLRDLRITPLVPRGTVADLIDIVHE